MATLSQAAEMVLDVPASVQPTLDSYVSTLTIHKPEEGGVLASRYGVQRVSDLLAMNAAFRPTAQTTFGHHEDAFIHASFEAQIATAPTSGQADSQFTMNASYITSNDKVYVRVNDIIMFQPNRQLALVTAVASDGSTFNATPYEAWSFTSAYDATDVRIIVVGNEFLENTDQPSGRTPEVHRYTNTTMIMKEAFEISGSEATNQIWFRTPGAVSKSGLDEYNWGLKGEYDTYLRMENQVEMTMLLGKNPATSGTLDAAGYNGTEGLIPWLENDGQILDLNSLPMTLDDVDQMTKQMDKYKAAKESALFAGFDLRNAVDNLLAGVNSTVAAQASYGTFNNSKDMALNLQFQSFNRNGYTFHMKTYDLFNHPQLLGADGFDYPGWGMVIPMDSVRDAKTNESIPSLSVRYKQLGKYSRLMEHWLTGSAGGITTPTNGEDNLKCNYRTERGFEGAKPNRFFLIRK